MTKEFLQENDIDTVAKQFDTELTEYINQVNKIDDREVILEMEKQVIAEQDEVSEYLKNLKYELPNNVEFDGNKFTVKDIANKIIYFLNKKEVEWKYTLGLYQLVKFWKQENPTEILYGAYDSTLRLLNQVTFRGFHEWRNILAVNEYLKSAHERYSKDTSWVLFCSEKHNALMDRMKQLDQVQAEVTETTETTE